MKEYVGYIVNDDEGASPFYDTVLFTNSRPKQYGITSGEISCKINSADQLTFKLPPSNVSREIIVPKKSVVRITEDNTTIFVGVVSDIKKDFAGNMTFTAEDFITSLARVVFSSGTSYQSTQSAINFITTSYTEAGAPLVHTWPLLPGNIEIQGTVTLNPDGKHLTLFDALKAVLSENGGFFKLRYGSSAVYLDYFEKQSAKTRQEIKFAKNILDISEQIDADTIISRVYPIGKDGLTIYSVEGREYLVSESAEREYGRIDKVVDVDTDDPAKLKQEGQKYLNQYAAMQNTIKLSALDLSAIDYSLDSFEVGNIVHVISPPQGIDADMPISEIKKDIVRPANSRITLGIETKKLTNFIGG